MTRDQKKNPKSDNPKGKPGDVTSLDVEGGSPSDPSNDPKNDALPAEM